MRAKIVGLGTIIGGLGLIGGYVLELPYTVYAVALGLLLIIVGIFMREKPKFS
jgi:hypothetical protein